MIAPRNSNGKRILGLRAQGVRIPIKTLLASIPFSSVARDAYLQFCQMVMPSSDFFYSVDYFAAQPAMLAMVFTAGIRKGAIKTAFRLLAQESEFSHNSNCC
ncbi:hypothetical protein SAMN05216316_0887 [Nitrosovibrio sp. Nv6]|nr:hypothetical protein SAMN05216316_0887 [Nitrosovibrio sp. Nv6]